MQAQLQPFNLGLLVPTPQDLQSLRPVKVQDIFVASSREFHPDGLFSIETFGKVGDEKRNRLFAFIDFKISIFHPTIYKAIIDLKSLYGGILSGKEYAVFDKVTKDFIKSNIVEGETGFAFFLKYFEQLEFEKRPSPQREVLIQLVDKYRKTCMIHQLIVMPAGLRDYSIDENGKPSEDEINPMYRKVLSISSSMDNVNLGVNSEYLDAGRYNIQLAVVEIYDYVISLLEGKKKLILGHWASRKINDTTRNVATSHIPEVTELHGDKSVSPNHTVVGLYQFLRAIMPLAVKNIRDTYLTQVFTGPNSPAILVNKKTLKKEQVGIEADDYDDWMTYEGIEKTCARFKEENLRHNVINISGRYLGLVYKGLDKTFKFVQDIDDLPEGYDPKYLSPITMAELLYMSVYKVAEKIPGFVTRYPITGYGSFYPGWTYLRTTVKSEVRTELDDNWQPMAFKAQEFPITDLSFFNSQSAASSHGPRLGLD